MDVKTRQLVRRSSTSSQGDDLMRAGCLMHWWVNLDSRRWQTRTRAHRPATDSHTPTHLYVPTIHCGESALWEKSVRPSWSLWGTYTHTHTHTLMTSVRGMLETTVLTSMTPEKSTVNSIKIYNCSLVSFSDAMNRLKLIFIKRDQLKCSERSEKQPFKQAKLGYTFAFQAKRNSYMRGLFGQKFYF